MSSRRSKLFVPVAAALVLVALLAIYRIGTSGSPLADSTAYASTLADTTGQAAPRPAPDFELKDVNGTVHHLSDYKGKVVVLNFWATWCPPCRKEIPDFVEMSKALSDQGVQFLGIAMDNEGLEKVKPWVESHGVSYPIMLPDDKISAGYGELSSIPVTFLIDRKGMIRAQFVGMRLRPVLEKDLAPLIAEK